MIVNDLIERIILIVFVKRHPYPQGFTLMALDKTYLNLLMIIIKGFVICSIKNHHLPLLLMIFCFYLPYFLIIIKGNKVKEIDVVSGS